jgi:hypothetical protein
MKVELGYSDLEVLIASMGAVNIKGSQAVDFGKLLGRFIVLRDKELKKIETQPFDKLSPELQHVAMVNQQQSTKLVSQPPTNVNGT